KSVNRSTYDALRNIRVDSNTGLSVDVSVLIPGTSGLESPSPSFQFSEPNRSTKWRLNTGNLQAIKWNSVGINPDHTYRFYLYSADGQYVDELGRRRANQREEYQAFNNYTPGAYKLRVQNEDTGEFLAWSETFLLTEVNDYPQTSGLSIVAISGNQVAGKLWFTDLNDDAVSLSVSSAPTKGDVQLQQTGSFTYTADANSSGGDTFVVNVSDGQLSASATVSVQIIDESELSDFSLVSSWNHGGSINDMEYSDGLIYTGGNNDDLIKIFDIDGNYIDAINPDGSGIAAMDVGGGYIAAVDHSEEIYVYNETTRNQVWMKNNIASGGVNDLVIGEGSVYVAFSDNEVVAPIQRYSLSSGSGGGFSYDGDYYNDGDDILSLYFHRYSKSGGDFILFSGTGGTDEDLEFWEEEGSSGYHAGRESFGKDVSAIFARDGFLYAGDDSGRLKKMTFTGSGFNEYGSGAFTKTGMHTNDISRIYSDGYDLFTGSFDYKVKVWNDSNGNLKQTLTGHTDLIVGLEYVNGYLITADRDGNIKVWKRNHIPSLSSTGLSTWSNTSGNVTLSVTDLDDTLHTFSIIANPSHGSASVNSEGVLTYTPSANYFGNDQVTVQVSDGKDTSSFAVAVEVLNRAPIADVSTSGAKPTVGYTVQLTGTGVDPEAYPISSYEWELLAKPASSNVSISSVDASSNSFVPDMAGLYRVSLSVSDGSVQSIPSILDVYVTNHPPQLFIADTSYVPGHVPYALN
ncbi:MAG: Ig-like domain-containing protein, partial [Candidatus Pacearchaeota archaeon]|nr:Ig-like domain-containing protein [Candidatus Pacearchaeota archaeon]